jgi:hypothetical protein
MTPAASATVRCGGVRRLKVMSPALVAAVCIALAFAVIVAAYRLGRRAGTRQTIPWRPIFQLVEHRTRCLHHDRARIERELGPVLGIPVWAWKELFALRRPLARRSTAERSPVR